MKSSEKFFNCVAPLFSIAMFAVGLILSIVAYNANGWWAAAGVFVLGLLVVGLFAKGMSVWNNDMYGEFFERSRNFLFKVSLLGVVLMVIGGLFFMASPVDFSVKVLAIGASVFAAPVIISALCGLIRYISNRIWIYRMSC